MRELIYNDNQVMGLTFEDVNILLLSGNTYSECTFTKCRFIDGADKDYSVVSSFFN